MPAMRWSRAVVLCSLVALVPEALPAQHASAGGTTGTAADSTASAAVLHGRAAADRRSLGGRFAGGLASGLLLGLIGTGITYAIAGSDDASLSAAEAAQLASANPVYSLAFQQGYTERLKARRKSSALTGGLLGTAAIVTIVLVANSSN